MNREQMAIEFRKEYEELCKKYDMEFAMFSMWDDENYSMEVYDKQQEAFILE